MPKKMQGNKVVSKILKAAKNGSEFAKLKNMAGMSSPDASNSPIQNPQPHYYPNSKSSMIEFLSSKMKKLLPSSSPTRNSKAATGSKKESTSLLPPRMALFGKASKPVKLDEADNIPILQKEARTSLIEGNDYSSMDGRLWTTIVKQDELTATTDAINNNDQPSPRPSTVVAARTWKRLIGLPYETDTEEVGERKDTPISKLASVPPPSPPVIQQNIQPTKAPPPTAASATNVGVSGPVSSALLKPPPSTPGPQPLVREKIQEILPHTGSSALDFSIPLRMRSRKPNFPIPPTPSATSTSSQRKPQQSRPPQPLVPKKVVATTVLPVRPETAKGHNPVLPVRPETARGGNQTVKIPDPPSILPPAPVSQSHSVTTPTPSRCPTPVPSGLIDNVAVVETPPPSRPTTASSTTRSKTDKSHQLPSRPPTSTIRVPPAPYPSKASVSSVTSVRTTSKNYNTPSSGALLAKNKHLTHKLTTAKGESSQQNQAFQKIKKKKIPIKFISPNAALAKERKELDMVACLDGCTSYEEAPIWLCFRLWDYTENLQQLQKFIKLGITEECRGDEIADMKKIFDFHGMNTCLDCFMLDEECNMRNVGYIIDDDVLISFNNILPYMTQYFVDLRDTFYGKSPEQNALIRQWINYCVRNIRGRRVSEYMWEEMNDHLGIDGFFGGTYRTMADTLMYVSLYNRVRRWEPQDFAKRYHLSRWFRLMQMDDRLRGGNQLLDVTHSSEYHPNYPFDHIEPDVLDLNKELKVKSGKIVEVAKKTEKEKAVKLKFLQKY